LKKPQEIYVGRLTRCCVFAENWQKNVRQAVRGNAESIMSQLPKNIKKIACLVG